jgi:hypothetical protein
MIGRLPPAKAGGKHRPAEDRPILERRLTALRSIRVRERIQDRQSRLVANAGWLMTGQCGFAAGTFDTSRGTEHTVW